MRRLGDRFQFRWALSIWLMLLCAPASAATCPTELEPLTHALLRDLPSYINRVNQRVLKRSQGNSYAIIASQPDFRPLPTGSSQDATPPDSTIQQIFFTVLERNYRDRRVTESQTYHWLFLVKAADGWRLSLIYSRLGAYPAATNKPLTPPRESSQGITGQAVELWLRDCRAGALR